MCEPSFGAPLPVIRASEAPYSLTTKVACNIVIAKQAEDNVAVLELCPSTGLNSEGFTPGFALSSSRDISPSRC